jgi:ABC-type lipoprotein release transport system permease subunit
LGLVLWQRIHQKTSEIGILRAFGASHGLISRLFVFQTAILSIFAIALCLGAGPLALKKGAAPWFLKLTESEGSPAPKAAGKSCESMSEPSAAAGENSPANRLAKAFVYRWPAFGITAGAALCVSLIATMLAAQFAAERDPAAALKVK